MKYHNNKLTVSHGWLSTANLKGKRQVYHEEELIIMSNQQFADVVLVHEMNSSRTITSVQRILIIFFIEFFCHAALSNVL